MEIAVHKTKRIPSFAFMTFLFVWLSSGLALSAETGSRAETCRRLKQQCEAVNVEAVNLAIEDMGKRFPGRYDAAKHRPSVDEFARNREALIKSLGEGKGEDVDRREAVGGCARGVAGESVAGRREDSFCPA
jgi:hypothetical protein